MVVRKRLYRLELSGFVVSYPRMVISMESVAPHRDAIPERARQEPFSSTLLLYLYREVSLFLLPGDYSPHSVARHSRVRGEFVNKLIGGYRFFRQLLED